MKSSCKFFLKGVLSLLLICFALVGCEQKVKAVEPDYTNDNPYNGNGLNISNENITSISPFEVMYGNVLEKKNISETDKEFLLNYSILYYYYPFAHSDSLVPKGTLWYSKRLENMSDYLGEGKKYFEPKPGVEFQKNTIDIIYMYKSLNDNFTMYVPAETMSFDDFIEQFEAREEITDLGVNIHSINSSLVVMQTYVGSTAKISGIQVGDTILTVNGIPVKNDSVFFQLTTGKVGDKLKLTVARLSNGVRVEKEFSLVLAAYIPPTVTYKIIDSVPVISISEFAENNTPSKAGTYGEFQDALKATEGYKSTIIDLRGNLGGDVSMCDAVSSEMLDINDTMYYTYQGDVDSITGNQAIVNVATVTQKAGNAMNRYFVFLADSNTASCSEITLVSVACNKKYPIVGTTTHGKGIAYALTSTFSGGTSVFTHSIVVDKNNQIYHTRGISPDIFEPNSNKALETAIKIAKEGTMVRVAGYSETVSPNYVKPDTYFAKKGFPESKKIPSRSDLGMIKKFNLKK